MSSPAPGEKHKLWNRALRAYARLVVSHPGRVLLTLVVVAAASTFATTRLRINSNQLDLIRQDLPEVQRVKRIIDMVGGAGFLTIGLRSNDRQTLHRVADDVDAMLVRDKKDVRSVSYRLPIEFIQKNIGLFIHTEDLLSAKARIDAYLQDRMRRASPFFFEIKPTPPVKLDLSDLYAKYDHIGQKEISDDYYVSRDGKLLVLFVKPMWDSDDLGKTHAYVAKLKAELARYSKTNDRGIKLQESYSPATPPKGTVTYGLTGAYKMMVDDQYAIIDSLAPVSLLAFALILLITFVFFRRPAPTAIVVSGMVVGTIIAMGFAWLVFRELNMITSILGGILMGFGVDYGIQFIYRARIELGAGKGYRQALEDAIANAGRPASIAAVVTGGSFLILLVSQFRGFSQFGLLAGCGTLIIGFTLFCWSPAILALVGKHNPSWPAKLVGVTPPPKERNEKGERRIPNPLRILGIASGVVAILCAAAIPWRPPPKNGAHTFRERLFRGVRFNFNTRALLPAREVSVKMEDEIDRRFQSSSDEVAVYTKTLAQAKEVYDEITNHPQKYPMVRQPVFSPYTFVPPYAQAVRNAKILAQWKAELSNIDVNVLPPAAQQKAHLFLQALSAKPYTVTQVPQVYTAQFRELPTSHYHGYLTLLYANADLRNDKAMQEFAREVGTIRADGQDYHAAGPAILYARLARTVLRDGYLTVLLAALWILTMHYLDFRSVKLAAASVLPLLLGLVTMLGIMALTGVELNFMNIIILPILLGFGVSHGLYLLHRFLEGTSPVVALQSVGAAVASSTLTAIAGFGALLVASHKGLQSMGLVATMGLATTLLVSFTVLAAVLQLLHDKRAKDGVAEHPAPSERAA